MVFRTVVRKSASTLTALAGRAVGSVEARRSFTGVGIRRIFLCDSGHSAFSYLRGYSAVAAAGSKKPSSAESLLRVVDDEIKAAEETDEHDQDVEVEEDFPFKIDDNPGQQTLILTRECDGEHVKVEVHMPDLVTGEDNDVCNDDDDNDDIERPTQSTLPLVVTVTKKSGMSLEFSCVAYADKIAIDSLSVKKPENSEEMVAYEGPNFHDLDENMKNAFHKYLEIRGIKASTTNFLHEYMINKDSREYLGWLKSLKEFIKA
ncbi:Uncharacterized protein At2g39795, mitochondrial [Linum perenne]